VVSFSCGSVFPCGDYSPTATTTPSLCALIPSNSLMRFWSIQVHHHHPKFFFSNSGVKTIPIGWCSHISGSTYTNNASRFFFRFGGSRPVHHVQFLFSCSGEGQPLHIVQSLTFYNPLYILVSCCTNSSPKAFLSNPFDVL
jgi:hypothetical protein